MSTNKNETTDLAFFFFVGLMSLGFLLVIGFLIYSLIIG